MVLGHPGLRLPRTAVGLLRQLNRLLYVRPGIEIIDSSEEVDHALLMPGHHRG